METRLYQFVFFVNTILVLYPVWTFDIQTQEKKHRLYNGLQTFEGIVQVNINGSWTNICATNFTQHAGHFCGAFISPKVYPRNVFGTNDTTDAILIDGCLSDTGDIDCQHQTSYVKTTECEQAAICCDESKDSEGCSDDWVSVNAVACKRDFKRASLESVFHLKLKKEEANYKKFWTTSAFKEISKPRNNTNNSLPDDDVVMSCFNDCLEKNRPFTRLTVKNETCDFQLTPDSENSRTFEHTEVITDDDILLCIVAEFNNSQPILTAEDCNNTYRDYRFYETKFQPPTVPAPTGITTNTTSSSMIDTSTTSTIKRTVTEPDATLNSDEAFKLPTWSYYFIAIVSLVLIIVVATVVCVVYKVRKMNRCQEDAKNNYKGNKTYSCRMPLKKQNSGDEYADILDCEMVDISAGSFKPPLPCREGEVIALDQYSTPHDTLASNLQDEYSITYDDPIRINQICGAKRSQKSSKKQSSKKSSSKDSNEIKKETANSDTESQGPCPTVTDGKERVKDNIEIKETDIDADLKQTDLKQSDFATSGRESEYEIAVESSDSNFFRIKNDTRGNGSTSDTSEYEITSLTNSDDAITKPKLFTEHVCLDCLSSEHLKAFGITIVPDDNCYSLCKDVAKRFSAPCTGTQISTTANGDGNNTVPMSVDDRVGSNSTTGNLSFPDASDKCSGPTRCSVCHSVYDRIGKYNRNNWIKYTDNVYQKFGHFHTPRHPVGKRINST